MSKSLRGLEIPTASIYCQGHRWVETMWPCGCWPPISWYGFWAYVLGCFVFFLCFWRKTWKIRWNDLPETFSHHSDLFKSTSFEHPGASIRVQMALHFSHNKFWQKHSDSIRCLSGQRDEAESQPALSEELRRTPYKRCSRRRKV